MAKVTTELQVTIPKVIANPFLSAAGSVYELPAMYDATTS